MRALLISEKPSQLRIIEPVYKKHMSEIGYDCDFLAQAGHLLTLKLPNELDEDYGSWCWEHLPFYPEEHGGWQYKIITGSGPSSSAAGRFKAIKDAVNSGVYDFIIHAGDPDQEGQLLVDLVLKQIKCKLPIKRYWTNDTTEAKVLDALKNLIDYKEPSQQNLLSASYCRQHSDYLFGMNLSEAASLKMNTRAALGRVKTPILGIVCKREDDIKNFVPHSSYGVKVDYSEDFSGQLYNSAEVKEDDETSGFVYFETKKEADDVIAELDKKATVEVYDKKRVEMYAPKLFKLATVQIEAGKYGYTSDKTLEIIESLYLKGYMSYPRTDCEYLASGEDYHAMIRSAMSVPSLVPFIKTISNSTIAKVKGTKKWVNDKELKSHGHSALVPTASKPDFESLTHDEQVIYEIICRRFVAIFLPPLVQDKVSLVADIKGHKFKSSGKTLVSAGFTEIFGTKLTDMIIPEHKVGDVLTVNEIGVAEKVAKCPSHLTDTDIIQICESPLKYLEDDKYKSLGKNLKIGTPATRADIIKRLQEKDKYLKSEKSGKKDFIVPTEKGREIYENIKFCKICRVDLTGEWEMNLEKVRDGELDSSEYESNIKADVKTLINDIKDAKMTAVKDSGSKSRTAICKCPECGGDILSSEKGFFCSSWKEKSCKMGSYGKICDSPITSKEFESLITGTEIVKEIKKGTSKWKQRLKYNMEEHKIEFVESKKEESKYNCPSCSTSLEDDGRVISCKCGFKFWKSSCGKTLTDSQIDSFFKNGRTGVIKGMKSKAGKSFNADIVLSDDGMGTKFEFAAK